MSIADSQGTRCKKFGYMLIGPGRPTHTAQAKALEAAGLLMSAIGPVWWEKIAPEKPRNRSRLPEREMLLRAIHMALDGGRCDEVELHVADIYCLGLAPAEAVGFLRDLFTHNVSVAIGKRIISRDCDLEAIAAEIKARQNTAQVAASRKRASRFVEKWPDMKPGKPCVYWHYDNDDLLLYVGATHNIINRMYAHRKKSHWFDDIARVEVKYKKSMGLAQKVEREEIIKREPYYNVHRYGGRGLKD